MATRYPSLLWDTKSVFPIVIEKFNAFDGSDDSRSVRGKYRVVGRAPLMHYALSRDAFWALTVFPDYSYEIHTTTCVIARDLYWLDTAAVRLRYVQLIINRDGSMRAKIRGISKMDIYEYRLDTEQWHAVTIDHTKPWNW